MNIFICFKYNGIATKVKKSEKNLYLAVKELYFFSLGFLTLKNTSSCRPNFYVNTPKTRIIETFVETFAYFSHKIVS